MCSFKRIIGDIVKYVDYVTNVKKVDMAAGLPKFSIASTVFKHLIMNSAHDSSPNL